MPPANDAVKNAADVYAKIKATLERISTGSPHPYTRDGITFQNRVVPGRAAPELPVAPIGTYQEYTIPTPGIATRGGRRLVIGGGGKYYTDKHYDRFRELTGF